MKVLSIAVISLGSFMMSKICKDLWGPEAAWLPTAVVLFWLGGQMLISTSAKEKLR